MPIQLMIAAGVIAAFLGSNVWMYSTGSSHATAVRDAYWSKQIADANKALEEATAAASHVVHADDEKRAQELATKELRIKDLEDEIEAQRTKTPLPAGCAACTIDRRRLERVR